LFGFVDAGAPAAPVLLESELVCPLAGKASIAAKSGTIAKLRKCLGEASKRMSYPPGYAETNPFNIYISHQGFTRS